MSAVLPSGEEINRNALIAMMAAILAPDYPGSTIITDSVTSDELTTFLQDELHLVHHRYMRGYKNVIDECIRLNKAGTVSPLAIETSGHGALSENYYLDDGAYLAVKLLMAAAKAKKAGKPLGDLIKASASLPKVSNTASKSAVTATYRLMVPTSSKPLKHGHRKRALPLPNRLTKRPTRISERLGPPSHVPPRSQYAP